mmetsp:Transcript_46324/g.86512  ORF Transcript_46324/g.86512 Transcript_46324/m.86512 type:complete len:319 (-) Transcript_46324:113-1069(-)
MLTRVATLHLVVIQSVRVHDFPIHGSCPHATPVVESPAPGVNLQQVVSIQLVGLVAEAKGNAPVWPVVELHPSVDVHLVHFEVWPDIDGIPIKLLHLPHGQWVEPGNLVEAKLVHGAGTARAIGEDQEDLPQSLLPLRHHHGTDVQERRDRVTWANDLQQVHRRQELLCDILLSNLCLGLRVLCADASLERLLDHVVATACVEDVVVGDLQERPAVHLVLQRLVARINTIHVGVNAILPINDRAHVKPADGLEEIEPVEDAGCTVRVMRQRGIRVVQGCRAGCAHREDGFPGSVRNVGRDSNAVAAVPPVRLDPVLRT